MGLPLCEALTSPLAKFHIPNFLLWSLQETPFSKTLGAVLVRGVSLQHDDDGDDLLPFSAGWGCCRNTLPQKRAPESQWKCWGPRGAEQTQQHSAFWNIRRQAVTRRV